MDSKMIKGCVAGLLLAVSSFAHAGLFKYDMTFQGGAPNAFVEGYGRIVADSDTDAIVLFAMKSTNSTPGFEVDFLWEGVSAMYSNERYYFGDVVIVPHLTALNSATGSSLIVDNVFLIAGLAGGQYAHRLNDNFQGEFGTFLHFGESQNHVYLGLGITRDTPESSALMLFALGLMGLVYRRFKKQA